MEAIWGLFVFFCLAMALNAIFKPKTPADIAAGKAAVKKATKVGWKIGRFMSGS